MVRKDKTRDGILAQKKGVCVAVIPFVEADILVDGSVYVELPKRSLITRIVSNVIVASGTFNATLFVNANGVFIAEALVDVVGITDTNLQSNAQYLETGGELIILASGIAPATGTLVGELIVEYIELDKNTGKYTTYLNS